MVLPLCSRCKQRKPASGQSWCSVCKKAYNAQYYQDNRTALQAYGRKGFARYYVTHRSEAIRVRVEIYNPRRRAQLRSVEAEDIGRRAVWGRDEGHCRIGLVCNKEFVPFKEMHLDHVTPLARGGTHTWNNVQTSCAPCNLAKGAAWTLQRTKGSYSAMSLIWRLKHSRPRCTKT